MAPLGDDVQFMLGRLEAKLDSVIASLTDHKAHAQTLENRIGALEAWKTKILGGATVIATGVSFLMHYWKG